MEPNKKSVLISVLLFIAISAVFSVLIEMAKGPGPSFYSFNSAYAQASTNPGALKLAAAGPSIMAISESDGSRGSGDVTGEPLLGDQGTATVLNEAHWANYPNDSRCDRLFFNCRLMKEIGKTHNFLLNSKNGLPYANDPRNLTPPSELVRLEIATQANGYLNLYKMTRNPVYLTEAQGRLNYMMGIGELAFRNQSFDGMVGHSFLYGYELTRNKAYLDYGLKIADRCVKYQDSMLNWGYMCAMALGKAYNITGNLSYLNKERSITRNTFPFQYPDGSFPHQPGMGPNTGYTSWIIFEMLQNRLDDPQNPDNDIEILNGIDFLVKRVNPNGSLNYQDQFGSYYYELGTTDSRGWISDLPSVAYNLQAVGKSNY